MVDAQGKTVRDLQAAKTPGLHRLQMSLFGGAARPGGPPQAARPTLVPGTYTLVLTVDDQEAKVPLKVEADPTAPPTAIASELTEEDQDDEEEGEID